MKPNQSQILLLIIIMVFILSCANTNPQNNTVNPNVQYSSLVEKFKKDYKIEGISIAIFNNDSILWEYCTGKTTEGKPVDNQTMFSLQSISKNITSLAVLIAVQDGILDLDSPISEYLPDFRVNSCFEDNPENRITLKMLLSNTAGFTHEAPIGNNYDYSFNSYEEHWKSISDTWLKFPAGKGYSYSNLGFDLAALIIEKKTGIQFEKYVENRIFKPLGMVSTTVNDSILILNPNRTDGVISGFLKPDHYKIPLIGSGAVYTNINDFVKYVQMHLNLGKIKSSQFINKKYLFDMYTILSNNYALGTYITEIDSAQVILHNGSGFGFGSSMLWIPEYNTGCVMFSNREVYSFEVAYKITKEIIGKSSVKEIQANEIVSLNENYFRNEKNAIYHVDYKCNGDTLYKEEWDKYLGEYSVILSEENFKWYAKLAFALGYKPFKIKFKKEDNILYMRGSFGESKLIEYQPGLFYTETYEVVDFRNEIPIYRNIRLKK